MPNGGAGLPPPPVQETSSSTNTSISQTPIVNMWAKSSVTLAGLPVFSGKPHENVREFLTKIAQRSKLDNWSESQTVTAIKYQLTGEAFELAESEDLFREEDTTYEKIEKFFSDKYRPKVIPGRGILKLNSCVQSAKETISEYATRLKITGRELYRENMSSIDSTNDADVRATNKRHTKDLIQQFQRGINSDIAKIVIFELHKEPRDTFEEVVELAQQAETSCEMLSLTRRHNEWRVHETNTHENRFPHNYRDPRNLKCYNCHKFGHMAINCRQKNELRCYGCNKLGHKRYECRQTASSSVNYVPNRPQGPAAARINKNTLN